MEPWKETKNIAVNFDIGANGVLPKIGVEVFSRWRHPLLVDKFIAGLEEAGLCLPSKADALRRWIRIRPDGDPFAQTLISYFKLVYRDGYIAEAKAYLEQSPYLHHHYFDAYEQPARIDFELSDGKKVLKAGDAFAKLWECKEDRVQTLQLSQTAANTFVRRTNAVRHVRFLGGESCEYLDRLLEECSGNGILAEVVLTGKVERARLEQMVGAGADSFLVDVNAGDGSALQTLKTLCRMGVVNVRARWFLDGSLSPCLYIDKRERWDKMIDYWETSPSLKDYRREEQSESCGNCRYIRRCCPCPVTAGQEPCPIK